MATVIDNTGGDPTAFGKAMSDIGTQMIHNRLAKQQVDQEQQRIQNQASQFNVQHELAKQQLDLQLKDFADKHDAYNRALQGNRIGNQLMAADLNAQPEAAPQSQFPPVSQGDVAPIAPPVMPTPAAVQPEAPAPASDLGTTQTQQPAVSPTAHTPTATKSNMSVKTPDMLEYLLGGAGNAVGAGVDHLKNAYFRAASLGQWSPADQSAEMTPEMQAAAAHRKAALNTRLASEASAQAASSPAAPVAAAEVPPQPSANGATVPYTGQPTATDGGFTPIQAPEAPKTPQQAVTNVVQAVSSPSTTTAQILGHSADPATSSIIMSLLPPSVGLELKKIANDPANRDVPMGPILQDYLKLKMSPLQQQVETQNLGNQMLQGQLDNITTRQAIDLMSGANHAGPDASPAAINQMASVYVKKLGFAPDQAMAIARSQALGRPILPKDQLDRLADQTDKLVKDPIAAAAQENMSSLDTLNKAAAQKNGQGDLAMIDAMNQIINKPGIKVSEGNVHLINDASALFNKFSSDFWKKKFESGDKLPEQERQKMLNLANDITGAHVDYVVKNILPKYEGVLDAAGMDKGYLGQEFRNFNPSNGRASTSSSRNIPNASRVVNLKDGRRVRVDSGNNILEVLK